MKLPKNIFVASLLALGFVPAAAFADRKADDEIMAFNYGYCENVRQLALIFYIDEQAWSQVSNQFWLRQDGWWLARVLDWADLDLGEYDEFRQQGASAAFEQSPRSQQPPNFFFPTLDACFEAAVQYVFKYNSQKTSFELMEHLKISRFLRREVEEQ